MFFPLLLAAAISPYIGDVGAPTPKPQTPAVPQMMLDSTVKGFIQIAPKERAKDYLEAFNQLKKERGTDKVFLELSNGSVISGIVDITTSSESTLLFVRTTPVQGNALLKVVPLESIQSLGAR